MPKVKIRNCKSVPISIFVDGKVVVINPFEVKEIEVEKAVDLDGYVIKEPKKKKRKKKKR